MTPLQQAAEWHGRLGCPHSFAETVAAHDAAGGFMVATPRVFAMVRPVRADWPADRFSDPRETAVEEGDCWHVWLLAGDLREAFRHLPHPLPWMSWHRRGVLRIRPLAAVKSAVERAG